MAVHFHLQPLLDLAMQRSDDAAQALMRFKQVWQEAELKQGQLETYLAEYRNRLQGNTQGGLSIDLWRDYQAFISKLEIAIKAQEEEVERCRVRWEQSQLEWQAREREVKAYDTLRERHVSAQQANEEKQEQRQQDEFARTQHRNRSVSED